LFLKNRLKQKFILTAELPGDLLDRLVGEIKFPFSLNDDPFRNQIRDGFVEMPFFGAAGPVNAAQIFHFFMQVFLSHR
jgi:hypothetical protein